VLTFALRAAAADQPIVENYVGRQVPTAMVARNLERGSGFLRPQLDTAPYPNFFVVEPPIYAATAVVVRRLTGVALEPAGRLVSALATALAAWGLFGLVRPREGSGPALWAVAALAIFPLTLRYGRAFQPDALMLGTLIAGLRCWDTHERGGSAAWLAPACVLLATGLALKIISVYLLLPLLVLIRRPPRWQKCLLGLGVVVPALVWYGHAARLLGEQDGSRAAADCGAIWLRVLVPSAFFRADTLRDALRLLTVRAFTPLGLLLAAAGLYRADRLWRIWAAAAAGMLVLLAGKAHHEYYWLALAPLAAVGVARSLALLARWQPVAGAGVGLALVGLALYQARTTWRTPAEWASLPEAARAVRALVPPEALVVAPEALLYSADRRGCRLEPPGPAARRAAGEWGSALEGDSTLALVEFYASRGARYVAVPGRPPDASPDDPERLALQEAIRRRYNVVIDRPVVLIAVLDDPQTKGSPDGHR
jgi:hypothetical protein